MTREVHARFPLSVSGLTVALVISGALAHAQQPAVQSLPNMGQQITPLAPQGSQFVPLNPGLADKPDWLVSQAVTSVVSPDHKTLLVLTSGFSRVYKVENPTVPPPWNIKDSNEYVFIYDISTPTPVQKQVVQIPNTYNGIVFDPSGTAFYVAGASDDVVHIITLNTTTGVWAEQPGTALALGHHRAARRWPESEA